eukprot:CAMPEP_0118995036 /NCGR_PEP_ID=MMETSP1173-20130426/57812_1 /TAXON_ID=1034831 /ORGANISM="Rhizochromulina marina cf, Strain CCMP1243" /LENGTH=52 /DNA_ID=CAMNT_0006946355 /DNA_START=81 /DNA_END=235 /DNA_ORIENTATION=+
MKVSLLAPSPSSKQVPTVPVSALPEEPSIHPTSAFFPLEEEATPHASRQHPR